MSSIAQRMLSSIKETETAARFRTREHAYLEVYGRVGKIFCKLENLSKSGANLRVVNCDYMPEAGEFSKITVHLRTLNKTHIIPTEIVWSNSLSLGIKFLDKEEAKQKLNQRYSSHV